MLPKNRLLAVDFSGVRRFQCAIVMKIMIESGTHIYSVFCNVTGLSFAGCFLSSYDLLLVSLCTQKLKSLTLTDRMVNHHLPKVDIDPSQIENFRVLEKQGLIGHRRAIISYVKKLWPTLQYLTLL
ncbi:unnamed protein product [Angiostrongylus costaricensis]|uniref:SWIB domain-containing protein n=1 Tax=Angiostrongylus costaricensis TaxID=334426 RepID=A0A0R3PXG5_ANGCS|nr:unnamed protein product [Angiostrongylus costaricensis]